MAPGEQGRPDLRRRAWMGLFARAERGQLEAFLKREASDVAVHPVRGPETGLVMVRGRIGGGGAPFNLGEATMSRASIRLEDGTIGHGQLLGSDRAHARLAAILDALGQTAAFTARVAALTQEIEARLTADDEGRAEETAATRVDFFTMVRGED
ncbi:phosphonate C-P lyase system protein PhnG [Xaviernesmea rhizosphaerae]|nr:phosphonate C-P lyase system protein PhnG [Xaviernesmea rhizosphaerae]